MNKGKDYTMYKIKLSYIGKGPYGGKVSKFEGQPAKFLLRALHEWIHCSSRPDRNASIGDLQFADDVVDFLQSATDNQTLDELMLFADQPDHWLAWFAENVGTPDRWFAAEPWLASDAESAATYANSNLRRRWFDVEPLILTDRIFSILYADCFNLKVVAGKFVHRSELLGPNDVIIELDDGEAVYWDEDSARVIVHRGNFTNALFRAPGVRLQRGELPLRVCNVSALKRYLRSGQSPRPLTVKMWEAATTTGDTSGRVDLPLRLGAGLRSLAETLANVNANEWVSYIIGDRVVYEPYFGSDLDALMFYVVADEETTPVSILRDEFVNRIMEIADQPGQAGNEQRIADIVTRQMAEVLSLGENEDNLLRALWVKPGKCMLGDLFFSQLGTLKADGSLKVEGLSVASLDEACTQIIELCEGSALRKFKVYPAQNGGVVVTNAGLWGAVYTPKMFGLTPLKTTSDNDADWRDSCVIFLGDWHRIVPAPIKLILNMAGIKDS